MLYLGIEHLAAQSLAARRDQIGVSDRPSFCVSVPGHSHGSVNTS